MPLIIDGKHAGCTFDNKGYILTDVPFLEEVLPLPQCFMVELRFNKRLFFRSQLYSRTGVYVLKQRFVHGEMG